MITRSYEADYGGGPTGHSTSAVGRKRTSYLEEGLCLLSGVIALLYLY